MFYRRSVDGLNCPNPLTATPNPRLALPLRLDAQRRFCPLHRPPREAGRPRFLLDVAHGHGAARQQVPQEACCVSHCVPLHGLDRRGE